MKTYTPWATRTKPILAELAQLAPPKILDWAIHISPEHKFLYVDNPKVGSGTIKARLTQCVSPQTDQHTLAAHNRSLSPLLSPAHLSDDELETALFSEQYRRFCFVRNPYTRILSAYLDKMSLKKIADSLSQLPNLGGGKKKNVNRRISARIHGRRQCLNAVGKDPDIWWQNISFEDFLHWIENMDQYYCNPHWRSQSSNLLFKRIEYHFVGKFETFERDLEIILSELFGIRRSDYNLSYKSGYATEASNKGQRYYTDKLCSRVCALYSDDFRELNYDIQPPFVIEGRTESSILK